MGREADRSSGRRQADQVSEASSRGQARILAGKRQTLLLHEVPRLGTGSV